ncbi:MAG: hypothetical protein A3F82_10190 [Deltaproteobacteria bacterium RIFCSPLOWO2_12_FULL_44_12]|nr:MAG: hypothetical protein A2712_00140 [Deltaproteobacteria bacterium RIFCSPHIGHO2_01_FULL_43_49]OGQ15828.1 MAG: hypothetical protein A3D22_02790 [Deltaproteobacteria bacterium RIFCSPHIGHO2_02_FULL_44_53]OGQ28782.1 MAG: hypothetical protein A3D98_01120 [Deltaproteobacteria bacterium RIFCSPHIGHO2_12_FULL_44_21]OGQ32102.1 MAG: hypothetical protein A2979_03245 [Deltaproteobacteria bacterium RIFCSPLOWO2_01_FULL_45_74]OGQ43755.1 MAG: hypothetical protein A3I70_05745 [Deltaproteobacteria bacterium 
MPIQKLVDEKFFDSWSPESAYILGLLMSDGTLTTNPRGSQYVEFLSTDRELVDLIRSLLNSNHKISLKRRSPSEPGKPAYRIQIGNKYMLSRLSKMGLSRKSAMPRIPKRYYRDFIRGFFDGDGCVMFSNFFRTQRQKRQDYFQVIFISRYRQFLQQLWTILIKEAYLKGGSIHNGTRCYRLSFCQRDGLKLFDFFYKDLDKRLRLSRKYKTFRRGARHFGAVV